MYYISCKCQGKIAHVWTTSDFQKFIHTVHTIRIAMEPIAGMLDTWEENSPQIVGHHAHTPSHSHSQLQAVYHQQSTFLHGFGHWTGDAGAAANKENSVCCWMFKWKVSFLSSFCSYSDANLKWFLLVFIQNKGIGWGKCYFWSTMRVRSKV